MSNTIRMSALALAFAAGVSGVALAQPGPPPGYPAIPPPQAEVIPPPPGSRYVWEPGHWHWDSRQYVWVAGHYIVRPPEYAHYEPGHWAPRDGAWVWVPAHWR